ncbi:winged helix-turn-helix domain-containing protein [Streptomyces sp. NBC_01384]|uniref:winged helix-turn-helix domain-containing protein n=1 Tax=Streptomyces sp. NBC_01384 TaxID=2903847 RepID=UPI00386EF828
MHPERQVDRIPAHAPKTRRPTSSTIALFTVSVEPEIAELYRVGPAEQGAGKYLRRWTLSFQRPDKRAVEQGAEAVRVWREETRSRLRHRGRWSVVGGRGRWSWSVVGGHGQ